MKLIIDIPDYDLDNIQNGSIVCGQVLKAVRNGIPYEESPQGEWICPNCDLYEQAENNYCQYAGKCTIVCRKCKYFKQKGGAE